LRGHASIQGSTDIPTLFDSLPGYLSMPKFGPSSKDLASYIKANKPRTGFWNNFDKYIVSLLKAYYGDAATKENDFGFNWLPRLTGDHSHQAYWLDMLDGKMDGLFVIGQNPAVAGPNSGMERRGLGKLKWLVVREMVETETASFWYASPEVQRGDLRTEDIETEVFLMPAAGHVEKEGTFTNTQRLLQWREKAVDPPGDARSENWFMYHLWRRVAEKAKLDPSPRNAGLLALTMNYTLEGDHREPSSPEILQEINGWTVADHKLVSGFGELKADGSSVCGCWIYSGVFPSEGRNRANERAPKDEYGHGWGWAWPADRRVIYNRASARPDGSPWSERKKLVWWDEAAKKWTGKDVPDFTATKPPNYVPQAGAEGDAALAGDKPYILHADGFGWLWVPVGLNDGPRPGGRTAASRKIRLDNAYCRVARRADRIAHSDPVARLGERPLRRSGVLPRRRSVQPLRVDMGRTRVGARSASVVSTSAQILIGICFRYWFRRAFKRVYDPDWTDL
jgi:formate dehydrogenase major subunit